MMNTLIKSKDILVQAIHILARPHRETYINESVIDGNREVANEARSALDVYWYALNLIRGM
jgi:hypothetical protein